MLSSFYQIFLKLADKVDREGISDEFKTWPDRFIFLELHPFECEKPTFDFIISIHYNLFITRFIITRFWI